MAKTKEYLGGVAIPTQDYYDQRIEEMEKAKQALLTFFQKLANGEEIEVNPVASKMADMKPGEFEDLKKSIKEGVIRLPIVIDADGRIVDGRHRVKALQQILSEYEKVTPGKPFKSDGEQEVWIGPIYLKGGKHYQVPVQQLSRGVEADASIDLNLNRRHFTPEERIEHQLRLLAAEGKSLMTRADASETGHAARWGEKMPTAPGPLAELPNENKVTVAKLVEGTPVSEKTARRYIKVKAEAPERAEAIMKGETTTKAEYEKLMKAKRSKKPKAEDASFTVVDAVNVPERINARLKEGPNAAALKELAEDSSKTERKAEDLTTKLAALALEFANGDDRIAKDALKLAMNII